MCPAGSNTRYPPDRVCPVGYFCPAGVGQPLHCPSGLYQDTPGSLKCKVCPAGFYCALRAADMVGIDGEEILYLEWVWW